MHEVFAQFALEVVRAGAAYGLSCRGEIVAVSTHDVNCLPLWSNEGVAREMQRRYWPTLRVERVPLDQVLSTYLATALAAGAPIGIGVAVHAQCVAIPPEAAFAGLLLALEMKRGRAGS
jgi:hypothetical protein